MTTMPPENMYPCSYRPDPFPRKLPPLPDFGPPINPSKESKLERFLDKVDSNDDGRLSYGEMSEAVDTNDNGFVSESEKDAMRDKLKAYMKDDNAIERMSPETLGKAKQLLEFLGDGDEQPHGPFHLPPNFRDVLKDLNDTRLD